MPKNSGVLDIKPKNNLVIDTKPRNSNTTFGIDQLFTVNISAGQPMGLLLALTYPVAFSVLSPITS